MVDVTSRESIHTLVETASAIGGIADRKRFLMDGGVTAAYWYGELVPKSNG